MSYKFQSLIIDGAKYDIDLDDYSTTNETAAYIASVINALDHSDSAVSGQYVSEVSEVNGVIFVTRAPLPTKLSDLSDFIITVTATGTDLNNYTTNGIYYFTTSVTPLNVPDGNSNGYLFVFNPTGTTAKKQIWIRQSGVQYQTYVRTGSGSDTTWSDWVRYAVTDDITSAIASLDYSDSAVSGQYVSEVKETDGIISVKRASLPTKLSDFTDDVVSGNYLSLSGGTMSGTITSNASMLFNHLNSNGYTTARLNSSNTYGILTLGSENNEGILRLVNNSAYYSQFRNSTLSANRTFTLPNKSGTVALISDLPTKLSDLTDDVVSGNYLSLSGGTMSGTMYSTKDLMFDQLDTNSSSVARLYYDSANNTDIFRVGNATNEGLIRLQNASNRYGQIRVPSLSVNRNYYLPDKSGTVALTDDIDDTLAINLIPFPYYESTEVQTGITFTNNSDGSVTVSGTSTSATSHYLVDLSTDIDIEPNTTYTLSGISGGSSGKYLLQMREYNGSAYTNTNLYSGSITFTTKSDTTSCQIRIYIYSGVTVSETIYPMLEKGSVAHSYKQYCGKGTNVNEVLVEHNEKIRYIGDQSSASGSATVGMTLTTLCTLGLSKGTYIVEAKVSESTPSGQCKIMQLLGSNLGTIYTKPFGTSLAVQSDVEIVTQVIVCTQPETLTLKGSYFYNNQTTTLGGVLTVTKLV